MNVHGRQTWLMTPRFGARVFLPRHRSYSGGVYVNFLTTRASESCALDPIHGPAGANQAPVRPGQPVQFNQNIMLAWSATLASVAPRSRQFVTRAYVWDRRRPTNAGGLADGRKPENCVALLPALTD
jgi:hypothetical protein